MEYFWLQRFKKISVNLSAKEFQQNNLIENILQIITDVKVDPKDVTLEFNRTNCNAIDEKETLSKLKQLKEYGIQNVHR